MELGRKTEMKKEKKSGVGDGKRSEYTRPMAFCGTEKTKDPSVLTKEKNKKTTVGPRLHLRSQGRGDWATGPIKGLDHVSIILDLRALWLDCARS